MATLLGQWARHVPLLLSVVAGCGHFHPLGWMHGPGPALVDATPVENPLFVPVTDREFVWLQVVDTVDDYFQIAREERVRLLGGTLVEGRIDTVPVVGATLLEPWRRDATPGFERLHSSLQSVRRRAQVRVTPVANGYAIELIVLKELEDVSRPEHATVGGATLRHDGSLVRAASSPDSEPMTLGWIPLGRDPTLEVQMLAELASRMAVAPLANKL